MMLQPPFSDSYYQPDMHIRRTEESSAFSVSPSQCLMTRPVGLTKLCLFPLEIRLGLLIILALSESV